MNWIPITLSLTLVTTLGFAQDGDTEKGPKAKNYKPWADSRSEVTVVVKKDASAITGPEAKNIKPWDQEVATAETVAVKKQQRKRLVGPKAKNQKPWQE